MRRTVFICIWLAGLLTGLELKAQEDVKSLHASARKYMQETDYSNAALVLNKALSLEPSNADLQNDLLFTYYLSRNYGKAIELGKQLTGADKPDIRSFQLLGLSYRAIEEPKEAEKLYKTGLKVFPNSGVLYNEYGEFLWAKEKFEPAVEQWEKGISADPNYSGNYYNAAKHYYLTKDKIWALIYGEIFVNLESYSRRTPEIKELLLNGYKKYFTNMGSLNAPNPKNGFEKAFSAGLDKHAGSVSAGISAASLTKLRSKFILDWYEKEPVSYPFRLFEYHRQLLKEGYFEAYNQWLFGAAQNLPAFQQWSQANATNYDAFIQFQRGRVFKLPTSQDYRWLNSKL
ncbi:tetratricopeptide repeat protein [Flavihumibacter sp. UBA7668]|uniref:tetratricopeptide repeat protein n=1 Tax=Flavihumibacter sp. UBA7668 TaxID=1946542 RepID=UPI0025B904E1|nr:tetratricopeptide repeat protein [Flavihumibacter sp. UBA7668]